MEWVQTWWKNGTSFAKTEPGSMAGQAWVATPGGIKSEVLEDKALKQGGYFDTKLLDAGYYQVDEGGKKEGETPTYKR